MGSRERKRAERQKRKTRSAERRETVGETAAETVAPRSDNGADAGRDLTARAESASERKDREAREALEPLEEGERPTVVTVGAIVCTVLVALSILGYALWDVLRPDESRPQTFGVLVFVVLIGSMAYGLWRARYWAVLGFQTTLVLVIIASALNLISALSLFLAIGSLIIMVGAGALFYFMIKAWARIQMPTRPGEP
jgi:preprotein translocase subunit YajC